MDGPRGLAIGPDGTVYVADTGNSRVRAISPTGTITTIAGNGMTGSPGGSGVATQAPVSQPVAVAFVSAHLYVVDDAGVQVVDKGMVTTVIRAGPGAIAIDATRTALFPTAITVDAAGDLYAADSSPKLLTECSATGRVLHHWEVYVSTAGLATAPDGTVLVADYGSFALDRIVGAQLGPVVTFSLGSIPALPGAFRPSGVAVAGDGTVYGDTDGVNGGTNEPALIAVGANGAVRLLTPQAPIGVLPTTGGPAPGGLLAAIPVATGSRSVADVVEPAGGAQRCDVNLFI